MTICISDQLFFQLFVLLRALPIRRWRKPVELHEFAVRRVIRENVYHAVPLPGLVWAAMTFAHVETGHRPDRSIIHRLEDARTAQGGIARARFDRASAGGNAIHVRQQARGPARSDDGLLVETIAFALSGVKFLARQFPVHAPAASASTARTEEAFKISSEIQGKRIKF